VGLFTTLLVVMGTLPINAFVEKAFTYLLVDTAHIKPDRAWPACAAASYSPGRFGNSATCPAS